MNSGRDYKHLSFGDIPVFGTGGYMLSVNDKLSSQDAIGIGRKGTINKPQFLKAPFWTVDTLFFVTSNKLTDIQFLYFLFQKINWLKFDESTGVPSLSKNTIEGIITKLPIEKEQSKIGNMLTIFDYIVDLHQREINILKKLKKAYLKEMFANHVNKDPNIRFKDFKEEWEQRKIEELFSERKERSAEGELISVTINSGVLKASTIDRKDNSSKDKSNYKVVKVGDIPYNSMRMWQGASGYSPYNGILSPAYTVLIPKENVNSKFFSYNFKRHEMIQIFRRNSQGLTPDTWNLKFPLLKNIKVKIPNIHEQNEISDYLERLDRLLVLHHSKLRYLKELKKEYLNKLFI